MSEPPINSYITEAATEKEDGFVPHRIFLNNIDIFNSRYFSAYITDQFQDVAKEGEELGEGEEDVQPEEPVEKGETHLGQKFQVIGTLKYDFHTPSEDILFVVDKSENDFEEKFLQCGFSIFDVSRNLYAIPEARNALTLLQSNLDNVQAVGPKTYAEYNEVRVFILISSVFTWALTKPIDPDDPELAFTEADFKKRRCHPNYKDLIDLEREVIAVGKKPEYKDKLKTYVICSGIVYGMEEEDLFFLFKLAWENHNLPLFKPGNNYIPLIHIKDLNKVIHSVMLATPKKRYILAVEQTPCNLKSILKKLSKYMGNGKIDEVEREDAFLLPYLKHRDYECSTLNLRMEPAFIVDELEIEWQNELNLAENMIAIINEFKSTRKLRSINIIIHGPPTVGKTVLAKYICDHYGTHYISVKTMIEDTVRDMKEKIEAEKAKRKLKEEQVNVETEDAEENEGEAEEEEEEVDIEELEQQVRDIENVILYSESKRLPEEEVTRLMKAYLRKNFIQNQGYVLDNYPKTTKQATDLFGGGEASGEGQEGEEGEGEGEEGGAKLLVKVLPNVVISLEADDNFLCKRIMQMTEEQLQESNYSEEDILKKLEEFRANNTEDNTMLNYFNERDIHPVLIDVRKYGTLELQFAYILPYIGPTSEFPMSDEEESECRAYDKARSKLLNDEKELRRQIEEKKALEEYENHMLEWNRLLEEMQMEEEKLLIAQSEPLRGYLMKFVFPTLTKGLLEVAKRKPNDPVDFLAEYLFKENPEGRMFDPSYTRTGELIERKYKEQVDY